MARRASSSAWRSCSQIVVHAHGGPTVGARSTGLPPAPAHRTPQSASPVPLRRCLRANSRRGTPRRRPRIPRSPDERRSVIAHRHRPQGSSSSRTEPFFTGSWRRGPTSDGGGSRVHDEHDRLSGSLYRPLLPRADRRHDGADDRQLRRQRRGSRVGRRAGCRRRRARTFSRLFQLARHGGPRVAGWPRASSRARQVSTPARLTRHIRARGVDARRDRCRDRCQRRGRARRSKPVRAWRGWTWRVSCRRRSSTAGATPDAEYHIVAYDYGIKRNILRLFDEQGCRVTVVPATTPAESVLARDPDGVFFSNGPGDPAAVAYAPDTIRNIAEHEVPSSGSALGISSSASPSAPRRRSSRMGIMAATSPCATSLRDGSSSHRRTTDSPWRAGPRGFREPPISR